MSGELQPVTTAEIDSLFANLPGDEATRVLSFADALGVFARSSDKRAAARAMAVRLLPLGFKGLSYKSLMRKLNDFRSGGAWSLVSAKYRNAKAVGLVGNTAFIEYWQTLCGDNRRKVHAAWQTLIRNFTLGDEIPGIGTWRDVYQKQRGFMPTSDEPCPWSERNPPPGWSYRNLLAFMPDEFTMTAAHHGMAEAKTRYGLKVVKTRVGLTCCRVIEVDDMWYEHSVLLPGNSEPQRVVEFAALDVFTAHIICRLTKAIREKDDGTRETLRSVWAKYVYHYILCVTGIPPEGCIIKGERGTTKSDREFKEALEDLNRYLKAAGRGPVVFDSGNLLNAPLAKGLANGAPKGNPRNKPHIEQYHATVKNRLGGVIGEIGGGRGVQPEETDAWKGEAKKLIALATACNLPLEKIKTPFLNFTEYTRILDGVHDEIDKRTVHSLEGWEACGFMVGEIKLKNELHWKSMPALADMSPTEAGAVTALVKAGMCEYRERRMSPREAWEKSRNVLQKAPEYLSPKILGSELCVIAKVNSNMQFVYKDPNIGTKLIIAAIANGKMLSRGQEYRVWVNPIDGDKAYVCDLQGRYLGVAKVMQAVCASATPEELAAQLGLRKKVLSEEAKRLIPIARKRLAAALERSKANIAALGLEDPVEIAETEKRKAIELQEADAADVQLEAEEVQVDAPTAEVTLDPTDEPEDPRVDFEHFDFD